MNSFVCHVREGIDDFERTLWREDCEKLDFYSEYDGKQYCVLHFPGENKQAAFEQAVKSKCAQKDYWFGGTVFTEGTSDFRGFEFDADTSFQGARFVGGADFSGAKFSGEFTRFGGATFGGHSTSFSDAQFSGNETDFSSAEFGSNWTTFSNAQFGGQSTSFSSAHFSNEQATFLAAKFSGQSTDFSEAKFSSETTLFVSTEFGSVETYFVWSILKRQVSFNQAIFKERVTFLGDKESDDKNLVFGSRAWAYFLHLRISKPEQFAFENVRLHPGWFLGTDVRKVDFTDVQWVGIPDKPKGLNLAIENRKRHVREATVALKEKGFAQAWRKLTATALDNEIEALRTHGTPSPHALLSQACRRFSANAEDNRDYPLANEFHYWSMNALRKEDWRRFGLIRTLYWALSGYGVRAVRAFWMLVGICVAFAALYMVFGPTKLQDLGQAIVYSLGAVARLNPEPRPTAPGLFQFLVIIEGILGPLQIALLTLAMRRKVLR